MSNPTATVTLSKVGDFSAYEIRNAHLAATILPALGGKITSIRNLRTGREWLWTSPYLEYKPPRYGASYIKEYDTGGIDECFPTVDGCFHPAHPWEGVYIPDHGELFSQPWQIGEVQIGPNGEIIMPLHVTGVRFPYRFSRTLVVSREKSQIGLRYSVENMSQFSFPFIWCIHPIMCIEPGMRINLPENTRMRIGFAVDDFPGHAGDTFYWPNVELGGSGRLDLGCVPTPTQSGHHPLGVKVFTDTLKEGWAELRSSDGSEAFRFSFSIDQIKHVAMWLNYGAWSGAGTPPYFNMAFEPAIGPCDALDIAVRYHHCAEIIPPMTIRSWSLDIEII